MSPTIGNSSGELGSKAFAAELYFDDGDDPIADTAHAGYWKTAEEAEHAIRLELRDRAGDEREGVWIGYVEPGSYVRSYPDDEDPLLAALVTFERDPDADLTPIHPEATR